jgi:hypothetical protein
MPAGSREQSSHTLFNTPGRSIVPELETLLASASPTATIFNRNFPFVEENLANGYRPETRLPDAWGSVHRPQGLSQNLLFMKHGALRTDRSVAAQADEGIS